ncbi:MAG: UvrB/UvrC motif-containing protein [Dictyoglomaceae bacterium]|nr:UvrB/UvrC motif-containing protein [Dictyoglomaceae bacterium]
MIIDINDGNKKERLSLCRDCFKDYYQKLLKNSFKELLQIIEEKFFKDKEYCSYCGRSWREIEKSKEIGCGNCYKIFKEKLDDLLEKMYRKKKYKGKIPKLSGEKRTEILKNKILLSKAIEEENYEKAAEIRDYLKKLRKG